VFLADRTGLPKPFVMNADTTLVTAVTSGGFYDDIPRWVP
jgi:Tol biopolymer transport system component